MPWFKRRKRSSPDVDEAMAKLKVKSAEDRLKDREQRRNLIDAAASGNQHAMKVVGTVFGKKGSGITMPEPTFMEKVGQEMFIRQLDSDPMDRMLELVEMSQKMTRRLGGGGGERSMWADIAEALAPAIGALVVNQLPAGAAQQIAQQQQTGRVTVTEEPRPALTQEPAPGMNDITILQATAAVAKLRRATGEQIAAFLRDNADPVFMGQIEQIALLPDEQIPATVAAVLQRGELPPNYARVLGALAADPAKLIEVAQAIRATVAGAEVIEGEEVLDDRPIRRTVGGTLDL